jgi:hypothetical protein
MITGPRKQFEARCRQRGYTLDEVRGCIVSVDADQITVDESHPSYPAAARPMAGGAGSELKALLRAIAGVSASPDCSCNARAQQMDDWGPDECERRLPEIVGWLEEQARARKLPFVRFAAEQAIKLAIRRARKAAAR